MWDKMTDLFNDFDVRQTEPMQSKIFPNGSQLMFLVVNEKVVSDSGKASPRYDVNAVARMQNESFFYTENNQLACIFLACVEEEKHPFVA